MKKVVMFVICLLALPVLVNAASLTKRITIDGIGDMNLSKNSYNLTLTTTLNYAEIEVEPANPSYTVTGDGKVDIQEGANKLVVTVSDGTNTEEYTINLTMKRPADETNGNPETGAFLSVTVVVAGLAIAGCLYFAKKSKMHKI